MPLIATPGHATANAYVTPGEALVLLMPTLRPAILEDEAILTGMGEGLTWATRLIEEQVLWRWGPATATQSLGAPFSEGTNRLGQSLTHPAYTTSTLSAASADNSINDSASSLPAASVADGLAISGFLIATDNNAVGAVVSRTISKIVLAGLTLVTEAEGAAITVQRLTMPTDIKRATAEYALLLLQAQGSPLANFGDLRGISSIADGDTKVVLRDTSGTSTGSRTAIYSVEERLPYPIRRMLAPYAVFAGMGMQVPTYRG